jgi:tetratricopeptide (TPR) repeat protein
VDHTQVLNTLNEVRKRPADCRRWADEARTLYYLAKFTDNQPEKRKLLEEGKALSLEAHLKDPSNSVAILAWTATAGSLAEMDKNFAALKTIREIEATLLVLKQQDPLFESSAADRVLGRLYQKAPNFISIGSASKARRHLEAALASSPEFPGNQAYLADFLCEQGDRREARELAHKVLESKSLSQYPYEADEWIAIAQRVLRKTQS